jgi:hypothetical protein
MTDTMSLNLVVNNTLKKWALQKLQDKTEYKLYIGETIQGMFFSDEDVKPLRFNDDTHLYIVSFIDTFMNETCATCNQEKHMGWVLTHNQYDGYIFYCIGCVLLN